MAHNWWGWNHKVQPESYSFYRQVQVKNTIFISALTAAFLYATSFFEPLNEPPCTPARLVVKITMALLAQSMVFVSVHVMPPAIFKPREDRMDIMKFVGSASYLTFWSLSIINIHCTLESLADLGVFLHGRDSIAFPMLRVISLARLGSVRSFCLYLSPFIQGWSVVLTALWLKFNWFEPKWFVEVVEFWQKRGVPIIAIQWWSHGTIILTPLDYFAEEPALLRKYCMPFSHLVLFVWIFSIYYIIQTDILFTINGGFWPYPFLATFATPLKQVMLVSGISLAVTALSGLFWLLCMNLDALM